MVPFSLRIEVVAKTFHLDVNEYAFDQRLPIYHLKGQLSLGNDARFHFFDTYPFEYLKESMDQAGQLDGYDETSLILKEQK